MASFCYLFIVSHSGLLLCSVRKIITIEESLGVGKHKLHHAVSLQQHGFLVCRCEGVDIEERS